MGCGSSMNAVAPLHYVENQNGSALLNNTHGSDVLEYMPQEDIKQADEQANKKIESQISIKDLTDILSQDAKNPFVCIRSFFRWISDNIRYDPQSDCTDAMSVLSVKRCSSEGYANLFEQMCRLRNITVIKIFSFVQNYSFKLDYDSLNDVKNVHVWNAVLINNSFHFVDCCWGALPVSGQKIRRNDIEDGDKFFLTSPEIVGDLC